jgi:hypothetical protein
MDFPREGQVGAGVLGLLGFSVEQMPDTPASPPLSQR